jgi:hypothetical protein
VIDKNVIKSKRKQTPLKSASWGILISIRHLRWVPFAPVLILLLFDYGFAGKLKYGTGIWEPPGREPDQMWSKIDYDPKLTHPFFKSNERSYQWSKNDKRPAKQAPRMKHMAECFITAPERGRDNDSVTFCEVKLIDLNAIDLLIHEHNVANTDALKVRIRNEMFTCQFWTALKKMPSGGVKWTTTRQELILDKKIYHKGEVIKGRIDYECIEEPINVNHIEKRDSNPITYKIYGAFKTVVE